MAAFWHSTMVWQLRFSLWKLPPTIYLSTFLFSVPKLLNSWVIFLGVWLCCQPKCLISIALISCQDGKVPKSPECFGFNYSEVYWHKAKYYFLQWQCCQAFQKSLRIQGKCLPTAKPTEWTSLSINTFSGSLFLYHIWRTCLHSQALFDLFSKWHCLFWVSEEIRKFSCKAIII